MTTARRLFLGSTLLAALLPVALAQAPAPVPRAQVPSPASPKQYDVVLRYRIFAGRNERLRQYFAFTKHLEAIGFAKDPGEFTEAEDPTESRMTGTIAGPVAARRILHDPAVRAVLLKPKGYVVPDELEKTVKVQIELVNLALDRQRPLWEQTVAQLQKSGFAHAIAYDHRRFTRIVGLIPGPTLESLLSDVRGLPAGWLTPEVPIEELPAPLKNVSPVRLVEVIPEPEDFPPIRPAPPGPEPVDPEKAHLRKIDPDLQDRIAKEGEAKIRFETILSTIPSEDDKLWRDPLYTSAPDLVIEGRLGPIVTGQALANRIPELAKLAEVSVVRLPRPSSPAVVLPRGDQQYNLDVLKQSGLARLQLEGYKGQGIRVAVVDSDFRGWKELRGKKLPADVRYLDFTSERNSNLEPDDFPGDPKTLGHGTECALALLLAAPKCDLTLIRVDPGAPYMLQSIAHYIRGERFVSESHQHRHEEFQLERDRLAAVKAVLMAERREILAKFGDDDETKALREAHQARMKKFEDEEKAYRDLLAKFLDLQNRFKDLKNLRIVASALAWNDGYVLGGASTLTQVFDDKPFANTLWFQAAGNTRHQSWSGLFRDEDGNGIAEFAPLETKLKPGRWSTELNFIGWQPHAKELSPDLPEKAKLRVSLQWREIHDPEFFGDPTDPYREPLARLQIQVLRQRDPAGEKVSADDLELVAQSILLPQRIDHQRSSSVYEQSVEFTAEPAGRYVVRLLGSVPRGIRPPGALSLPEMKEKTWELRPRLFVDVIDPDYRMVGRPIFLDFPTEVGALGVPGDGRYVVTVGAAGPDGRPRPYSTFGPAVGIELLSKPNALAFDGMALGDGEANGTSVAAAFAAGQAAASLSGGVDRNVLLRVLRERQGKMLKLP